MPKITIKAIAASVITTVITWAIINRVEPVKNFVSGGTTNA